MEGNRRGVSITTAGRTFAATVGNHSQATRKTR
jgi:hypothetical protein